jgi:hypothetical protein
MDNRKVVSKKLVIPVWRLWLMNQAYRFIPGRKNGFGPGFGSLIRYELLRLKHCIYEQDRMRWRALQLRMAFSQRASRKTNKA